jgi:hypothetical protein
MAFKVQVGPPQIASYFQFKSAARTYTAFRRDETTFLVLYIGANMPQARAAGSAFMPAHYVGIHARRAPQQALCRTLASGVTARLNNSRYPRWSS